MRKLPSAKIILFPTFNSLQMLAHRILLPYQEMQTLSLTGRPWDAFDSALIRGDKLIGVLTDREKTPATIAARMLEYGYDNYRSLPICFPLSQLPDTAKKQGASPSVRNSRK